MADMTKTTMDIWLEEQWSHLVSVTYRAQTMLANLVDRRWEPELGVGFGDTVNIPTFAGASLATKRSTFGTGAALTPSAETESQVQLIVNVWAYDYFKVPQEMSAQTMPQYITMRMKNGGEALARQIDTDIAADNTNGFDAYSTAVGTDNVDITEPDITTCAINLDNVNAPDADRFLAVSPASYASLYGIEAFRNQLTASSMGSIAAGKGFGYVGHINCFDVYKTNLLEAGTSGKKNAAFQREATALAVQLKPTFKHDFNIEDGAFDQYLVSCAYGLKEVKDNHGNELDGK